MNANGKDGRNMSELNRTTPCRGCGKQIAFIKTTKGKSIPVNPETVYFMPSGGPNTYVMADGTVKRGREPDWADKGAWIGYISHFATCPAAGQFRKNRAEESR